MPRFGLFLLSLWSCVVFGDPAPWVIDANALKGVVNPVTAAKRAASIERGQVLFARECSACHGARGKGDGPDGLYFTTTPTDLTAPAVTKQGDAVLFVKLRQGRGDMKGYEKIYDATQRWDLVNAMRALK